MNQNVNGLDVITRTKVERSVLVTSHHNNPIIHEIAKLSNTKILPKLLAAEVIIKVIELQQQEEPVQADIMRNVELVMADDDIYLVQAFKRYVSDIKPVDTYTKAQELVSNISQYDKSTIFVIDNQFKEENISGIDVLNKLYQMGYTNLYLYSGTDFSNDSRIPLYIKTIVKPGLEIIDELLAGIN